MDSHAHLDYFDEPNRSEIIERAWQRGIRAMITISTDLESAKALPTLCQKWPGKIFHTVGVHPSEIREDAADDLEQKLEILLQNSSLVPVALGETGLDDSRLPKGKAAATRVMALQERVFSAHISVAKNAHLPLVIHCRDREGRTEVFERINGLLDAAKFDRQRAVLHCYSYGPKELERWQGEGGYVSFSGLVTHAPRGLHVQEALKLAQKDRIFFETDCPFLLPEPLRTENPKGQNEPANVSCVSDFCAKLLGIPCEEMAQVGLENGVRFFALEGRLS